MASSDARAHPATWPERHGPERRDAIGAALCSIAWVLACSAAGLDLGARLVDVSAVPASIAFHLDVVVLVLLAAVLLADGVAHRRGSAEHGGLQESWCELVALAATAALVGGRLLFTATAPTVRVLAAVVPIPAVALTIELWTRRRAELRPATRAVRRFADAWCLLAAGSLLAVAAAPERSGTVALQTVELRAIAWSMAAVGLGGALAALSTGHRGRSASCCVVVAGGAALAVWPLHGRTSGLTAPAVVVALVALVTLVTPWAAVTTAIVHRARAAAVAVGATIRRLWRLTRRVSRPRRARRRLATLRSRYRRLTLADTSRPPAMSTGDRAGAALMALGSIVFVAVGAAWAHRVGWQPTGHAATVMARAYDVGTVNHPWIGMITSFGDEGGASHPGPLVFDVLAPAVRLFGVANGALAGGVVVTLAVWWVAVWAAWRAAGRMGAVAAWAMSAVVIEVAGLGAVWESNNVTITMLAMFATIVACWATASGTWRAWWWAVALGSFAAQGYLPHGLVVIGPVLWSGLVLVRSSRSDIADSARPARRALIGGLVIAAIAWVQPLVDVVIHAGGNVRELLEQIRHPQPPVGPTGIPLALSWAAAIPPRWHEVTGSFARAGNAVDFLRGRVAAGLAVASLLAVLCWVTWRAADRSERQLRILVATVLVGAAIDVTQLPQDRLHSFQIGWLVVVSLTIWFAVLIGGASALRRVLVSRAGPWVRPVRAASYGLAAVVVLAAAMAGPTTIADVKGEQFTVDAMVDPLTDQTLEHVDVDGPVLVLGLDHRLNQVNTDTVLSNLIVGGLDVRVEPINKHYGPHRIVEDGWTGPMLWVTSGLGPIEPDGVRLASASMPGWDRAEFDELARSVADELATAHEIELDTWVEDRLPRYLASWVDDPCAVAAAIRDGSYPISSLPPGLLLVMVADQAITTPRTPPSTSARAEAVVGQAPVEVWQVEGHVDGPIDSDDLLRDGSRCPVG